MGRVNNKELNYYCVVNNIKSHLMISYTPKQNMVGDYTNETIMNMVRCALNEKGL